MNCDWADVAVLNATGLNAASLKYNELECNGPNAVMLKSGEFQADKFQLRGSLPLCRAPVVPCSVWTIGESAVNLQEFGSLSPKGRMRNSVKNNV